MTYLITPVEPELLAHQPDWTLTQYEAITEAGIIGPADKLELLFGKIVKKISLGDLHAYCVQELNYFMIQNFGDRFIGRQEQPIAIPPHSVPEPDYALATLQPHRYRRQKPQPADIKLIVEVADSTLLRDQGAKARLYGSAGIPEYWIINLVENRLEVYTEPRPEVGGYGKQEIYRKEETFISVALGELKVAAVMKG